MVDFAKLTAELKAARKHPQYDYSYRCSKCGKDVVFTTKMPDHLLHHTPLGGRCRGLLVIREAICRPLTQEQMDNLEEGCEILVRFNNRGPGAYACAVHIAEDNWRFVLLADERVYLVANDITEATVLPRGTAARETRP